MGDEFDVDAFLSDYRPYISSAKVCGRADLIAEHARLDAEWMAAKQDAADVMHDPRSSELEAEVRRVQAEIEASEKTFTFQSVGHEAWQNLKRRFPPDEEARKLGLDTDLDRFAPAAIAECSLSPKVTKPQAETMARKLPPGEYEKLYRAVLEANGEVVGTPKSVLAALTDQSRRSDAFSTTGLNGASHAADSSGTPAGPSPNTTTTTTDD